MLKILKRNVKVYSTTLNDFDKLISKLIVLDLHFWDCGMLEHWSVALKPVR